MRLRTRIEHPKGRHLRRHQILEGIPQIRPPLLGVEALSQILEESPPERTERAGRKENRVE